MRSNRYVVALAVLSWHIPLATSNASDQSRVSPSWGIYVAPTSYRFVSGPAFDSASSGTSVEFGLFYTRPISPSFALRLELRTVDRRIVTTPQPDLPVAVSEDFVEVPVLISIGRSFSERDVRVTVAGGVSYAVLASQDLAAQPGSSLPPEVSTELSFGDYQKVAWLADAGVSISVDARTRALARFRFQQDFDVFGESDDVWIAREYVAYGFYGGLEWSF